MKNTQNEKISQIKDSTLVIGIDVAKETHYARAFDFRGIELTKLLKFSNTGEGFDHLSQWMQNICRQHEKAEIIVGFEPKMCIRDRAIRVILPFKPCSCR